ncbi:MAG: beta-lactamase family protein [Anaerolineae bacterium]|nr:beta-lactamase family protein [Anaerolineae bacterium]MCO5194319.1 beta-lactamase family protein [Anaerolineae bacterium]MCO5208014.1 beta-lactamase family protein [Anaerolineae bacterium]
MTGQFEHIHGTVAPGFERVRDEFVRNFAERGELGAACAIYLHGEKVVDLWGGVCDHRSQALWHRDTVVPVFSTTKGLASMAVAHAHSRGLFDYDDSVAHYWPEFAQNGKERITIRQLLSHQAGLCAIDAPLDFAALADPDQMATAIARQKPAWQPGKRHGYHAITLGWYESELIRRVDPQKRTIGRYFHDEIAVPLGIEFYIGLPEDYPRDCVATLKTYKPWQMLFNLNKMPWPFVKAMLNPKSLTARSFNNPPLMGDMARYNDSDMQTIEVPAANGIGQVRGMAKAYGEFATGGSKLGLSTKTLAALTDSAELPSGGAMDQVLRFKTAFSLGYLKPSDDLHFGSSRRAFGTAGAGGSFAFADPDAGIGFAYAPNKLGYYLPFDPRDMALRQALYDCLGLQQI